MIVVRHRKGPLAGKEDRPPLDSERIIFGRDPTVCQVVYPADATIVARRHFALVRELSGEWTVDLFGDPYVAKNGEPAEHGATVHSGDTFTLGRRDGPGFDVELTKEGVADHLPFTQTQERVESNYRKSRRASRFAAAAILAAIVAAGGAGTVAWFMRQDSEKLASLVTKVDDAAASTISKEVRDRLISAAYYVFAEGVGSGSASPVAPDTMVTNSHVAEMFDSLKPGRKMYVRGPGLNGKRYEVVSVQKHPGYDEFSKYMQTDLMFVNGRRVVGGLAVPAYDVAIMKLTPGSDAGPVLQLASPEEILALKPGTALASAGYPAEGIVGAEMATEGATPTLSIGVVTAMTDAFHLPTDPAHQTLVHHNLPSTGGASGSPMIGPNGRVVALLNAGNMFRPTEGGPRQASAAMINYAQRADMLRSLLDGRAETDLQSDRQYWSKQVARFKQGIEFIVPLIIEAVKKEPDNRIPEAATPTLVTSQKLQLKAADAYEVDGQVKDPETGRVKPGRVKKRQAIIPIKVEAGKTHTFIAYAQGATAIELYVVQDNQIVRQMSAERQFAYATFQAPAEKTLQIYIAGPDSDVNFTLFDYAWGGPPS